MPACSSWRLYAADALLLLAQRLRAAHTTEERRSAIAKVVMDPSLELVYPRPRDAGGWVTADGWPVRLPEDDADRAVTVIESDTGPVAALIHDAGLNEQRAFLEAVGGFALVWDENQRLAERVDTSNEELQESRARILAAADNERRRIERDLHDGGQQRLVALRIRLQLAEEMMAKSPAGAREMLQRLARDVDGVLEELRSLAAGVYPAALSAHGLPDAVRAVATESPLPVHVKVTRVRPLRRRGRGGGVLLLPRGDAERREARARLHADLGRARARRATCASRSATTGPASTSEATQRRGLDNMRDRVAALGGRLEVVSAPGGGTRIRGWLPGAPRVRTPQPPQGGGPELLLADEYRGA